MHLRRLEVQNFRSLESIEVEFDNLVSVIIGPNAVGKTTVLEAIRLVKGLLAPRTQNESNQILHSLGIMSPHQPQRLFPGAVTNKHSIPVVIKTKFTLLPKEIDLLSNALPRLMATFAQQSMGLSFANPNQLISFFSSPQGQAALKGAEGALRSELDNVKLNKSLDLDLVIDFNNGSMSGQNQIHQLFASAIEQSLGPSKTYFSYFPADRALPVGEQPVQLGISELPVSWSRIIHSLSLNINA